MKKIVLALICILTIASGYYLYKNYSKYNDYKDKINDAKKSNEKLDNDTEKSKKEKDELIEKYKLIEEEKKSKVEELKLWQKRAEDIKDLI